MDSEWRDAWLSYSTVTGWAYQFTTSLCLYGGHYITACDDKIWEKEPSHAIIFHFRYKIMKIVFLKSFVGNPSWRFIILLDVFSITITHTHIQTAKIKRPYLESASSLGVNHWFLGGTSDLLNLGVKKCKNINTNKKPQIKTRLWFYANKIISYHSCQSFCNEHSKQLFFPVHQKWINSVKSLHTVYFEWYVLYSGLGFLWKLKD